MAQGRGMEGWTSGGMTEEASKLLDKMTAETGLNKREIATLAIHWFFTSKRYMELTEAVKKIQELKAQITQIEIEYPHLTDMKL